MGAIVRAAKARCPDDEVLVVVNGTTDATASEAVAAGATVIQSEPGYGQALLAGYRYAAGKENWSCLVQMDADGQHPVDSIPELKAALTNADLVIASRLSPGGTSPG